MGQWGRRVSYSGFMGSWSLLPAQPTRVQVSSWVVGLGWEMTTVLHPWSEESPIVQWWGQVLSKPLWCLA